MNFSMRETDRALRAYGSVWRKFFSRLTLIIINTALFLCIFLAALSISICAGAFSGILDTSPDVNMESIVPLGYSSSIYNARGELVETLVTEGSNREEATYEELPEDLINAFVAIEDSRFWTHNGIDLRAILRAGTGVLTGENRGGGSTITQQLIKNNVFNGGMEKSFGAKLERKLQEQYLAVMLTKTMDKKLILTNYLNTINLGNNTLGVKVAARRYFGKELDELTLSECAVIAGITQNPAHLNPVTGQKRNAEKRKIILQYMLDQGYITEEERDEALADDVYSRVQAVDATSRETTSPYTYFTDELVCQVRQAICDELGYSDTQAYNLLYSGGLNIYTTQDPDIQAVVDEEVNNEENYPVTRFSLSYRLTVSHADGSRTNYSEKDIEKWHSKTIDASFDGLYDTREEAEADAAAFKASVMADSDTLEGESLTTVLEPQVSFVVMDQKTGYVLAVNGGRGEKKASLTLNRATQTLRQPGSTFKVLTTFAPAIDTCDKTLASTYYDEPYTIGSKTFKNWYSQGYLGYSSIRDGIVYSMNIVAVRCLAETVGPSLGMSYAENFGISSLTDSDENAALALGGITDGVTNLELTGAYASIANGGVYNKPVFFTRVTDHDGRILLEHKPTTRRVLKETSAFLLTDAMEESMESHTKWAGSYSVSSTSTRARLEDMSCAGKSGTTSSNNDVWFVGYTPYYTAGVWAGCDSNQKLSAQNGGTSFHKDIWRRIMTRINSGLTDTGFEKPDDIVTASVCRKSGDLANAGLCENDPRGSAVYTEYFAASSVPQKLCSTHSLVSVCSRTGLLPEETCPTEKRVLLKLPEDSVAYTDDSPYGVPYKYCTEDYGGEAINDEDADTDDDDITSTYLSPSAKAQSSKVSGSTSPTASASPAASAAPAASAGTSAASSYSAPTSAASSNSAPTSAASSYSAPSSVSGTPRQRQDPGSANGAVSAKPGTR